MEYYKIYCQDSRTMPELADESVDLVATDPPYGISFMGKDWDKALPDIQIWRECLRVLKPGAFAFVMSIPRADCLSRMIISLEDAGFRVNFTPIYWAYASGFPKAQNIGKAVDKRLGVEREVMGIKLYDGKPRPNIQTTDGCNDGWKRPSHEMNYSKESRVTTAPSTPQAKALDGSYGGFQPKPAVEVIIVAMKPLSEKTFVDQAIKNGKGITWLDDCRVPTQPRTTHKNGNYTGNSSSDAIFPMPNIKTVEPSGRFPANLIVSDDVLNDGIVRKNGGQNLTSYRETWVRQETKPTRLAGDSGSFSRYFDLDKWWIERIKELPESLQKTFPFLIVPKASKSEKNKGCEGLPLIDRPGVYDDDNYEWKEGHRIAKPTHNSHPTVKPLKLMSYLITLGSRPGDVVVDPFGGTMTTGIACKILGRSFYGYDINADACKIGRARMDADWQKGF